MKTLKERIDELKEKFYKRQKEIDKFLTETTETIEHLNEMIETIDETIINIKQMMNDTQNLIVKLSEDYELLKKQLQGNFWMKLFGVTIR